MIYYKHFAGISLLVLTILMLQGCKKEHNPADSPLPNESEVLAKYLEANGDFINTQAPVLISAAEVREGQINRARQIVLDLRSNCDFHTKGHIEGAVIIQMKDIPWYYRNNDLASMDKVIITCGNGNHASYAAAVLRYYGYPNVYAMTWGMSSWNAKQDVMTTSVSSKYASQFETASHEKNAAGSLPNITTSKTKAEDILAERVKETLIAGYDDVKLTADELFADLSGYYVINYAASEIYSSAHIKGGIQYTPGSDLRISTYLKTLPADKKIAIYCSTGHTSAHAAAYLRILGYKVKTVELGSNGMNYSTMTGKKFSTEDINNYPYIR